MRRHFTRSDSKNQTGTEPSQQTARTSVGVSAEPAGDIAQDLKANIQIRIIAEVDAAEIQGTRTHKVRTTILGSVGCLLSHGDLLVLACLGISRRRQRESGNGHESKHPEWQR